MDFFIPFALSCIQAPRLSGYGSILQEDHWSDVLGRALEIRIPLDLLNITYGFFIPSALSCIQASRLSGCGSILQQDHWRNYMFCCCSQFEQRT
jgi:hypothetical protein